MHTYTNTDTSNQRQLKASHHIPGYLPAAICLLAAAIFFLLRNYYEEPVSDDLLYRYIQGDKALGSNTLDRPVQTLGDAVESQSQQYFHTNGRFIVHILVQMFTGPWGGIPFFLINTLMLLGAIIAITRYSFGPDVRCRLWPWMLVTATFFYLYPGNCYIWFSVAGAFNYLYPLLLSVLFVAAYDRLRRGNASGRVQLTGFCVLAFLTGFSQECYAIPLAASTFLYVVTRFRRMSRQLWLVSTILWLGAALLVLAPGNFERASGAQSVTSMMVRGAEYLLCTWTFWAFIVLAIWLRIKNKSSWNAFLDNNFISTFAWTIACVLGFVANTRLQSFYGIAFFSTLLSLRAINSLIGRTAHRAWPDIVASVLLVLFILHQSMIVSAAREMRDYHRELVSAYNASADGVVLISEAPQRNAFTRPYVRTWFEDDPMVVEWNMRTLQQYYGSDKKPLIWMNRKEYQTYKKLDSRYSSLESVGGDSRLRRTGDYIWTQEGNFRPGDRVTVTFVKPIPNLLDRFKDLVRTIKGAERIPAVQSVEIMPADTALSTVVPGYRIVMRQHEKIVDVSVRNDPAK